MPGQGLVEPFLLDVMACNADDASSRGMAGTVEMNASLNAADARFARDFPAGPPAQFMRLFREECQGPPDKPRPPGRPSPPPHSSLSHQALPVAKISTVATLATLIRLMSEADKERFEVEWGVRFNVSGASGGADFHALFEQMLVRRLGRVAAASRTFRMAPDEAHGRPYLWFTSKDDFDQVLAARANRGFTSADIARDFLGLIHHGTTSWDTGGPNHLVALHLPAAVAAAAGHMRPSVPQAFDNRRFVLSFAHPAATTRADWGRTLDLDHFAACSSGPPAGGRERVLLRLQADLFDGDMRVEFDHLGEVRHTRGDVVGRDDDPAFVDLLARGRQVGPLVAAMCR